MAIRLCPHQRICGDYIGMSLSGQKLTFNRSTQVKSREVADRSGWFGNATSLLRRVADFDPHSLSVLVPSPKLVADLRRNSAGRRVGFQIFDHLDFGPGEIEEQFAGFIRPEATEPASWLGLTSRV
jgi:hypothetical protein